MAQCINTWAGDVGPSNLLADRHVLSNRTCCWDLSRIILARQSGAAWGFQNKEIGHEPTIPQGPMESQYVPSYVPMESLFHSAFCIILLILMDAHDTQGPNARGCQRRHRSGSHNLELQDGCRRQMACSVWMFSSLDRSEILAQRSPVLQGSKVLECFRTPWLKPLRNFTLCVSSGPISRDATIHWSALAMIDCTYHHIYPSKASSWFYQLLFGHVYVCVCLCVFPSIGLSVQGTLSDIAQDASIKQLFQQVPRCGGFATQKIALEMLLVNK